MKRYRRIEITAFRRCLTVTSGGTRPDFPAQTSLVPDEGVWLNDADSGEAIEFDSQEGQVILWNAVRSLERQLSPQVRATRCAYSETSGLQVLKRNGFYLKCQSFKRLFLSNALRFARKEK